jgi:uncharacterized protein YggE
LLILLDSSAVTHPHERRKAGTMTDRNGTLNVTGIGKVQAAPDEAVVQLSVMTEGKTAIEATASNAKATQAVLDAVASQPNHGVTTTGLSLGPIMSFDPNTSVGTIVGFRATNGVEVKTKVDYAAQIYDAGIAAGANQSSGISFRIQDEAPYREDALRLALDHAYKEANLVAGAINIQLMGPESIRIEPGSERLVLRAGAVDAKAVTTPVIPEDMTIAATVQIVFRTRG